MSKKFKTSLFGFKKKDVTKYLSSYSVETQNALDEKEDKIEDLSKEVEALRAKVKEYEDNNKYVGNAILAAEKKAHDIISEAEREALDRKKEIEEEIKQSNMVLKRLNEEIKQLRHSLMVSVDKYKNDLDVIISASEEN
jgi:cell division initiation protein